MTEGKKKMIQPMEGHTVHRFDGELNNLHMLILEMGGLVLDQVRQAIKAVTEKNIESARLVIQREPEVDALEVKIDEENIIVIAKRCPVAKDLRITTAVSKAVTDLERIGDEAARIANQAMQFYGSDASDPNSHLLRDIKTMGNLAQRMLQDALDIFDTFDINRARVLARGNVELDEEFQSSLRRLATFVLEDARNVGHTITITLIIKALERVGEHARNLAEYVIYVVKGEDVRHQTASGGAKPQSRS
jgi:phosphate transport system protein